MTWEGKSGSAVIFLLLLLLFLRCSLETCAFPFDAQSGVTELSTSGVPTFVGAHKPVVVLFYASWCGHCKNFYPEYLKFADAVKGTIRVGAIDAHKHSTAGQQFGVRGFPTVKYWKLGNKTVYAPDEYQGPRSAASLQSLMMRDIRSDMVVQSARTPEDVLRLVEESPKGKIAVLFSLKKRVPPIFSVLSNSQRLKNLTFVFLSGNENAFRSKFGIAQMPTVAVIQKSLAAAHGEDATQDNGANPLLPVKTVVFPGRKFAYEPIAKFLLLCLEQQDGVDGDGSKSAPTRQSVRSPAAAADQNAERATPEEHALSKRHVFRFPHHPPSLTSATQFTEEAFKHYCFANSTRMLGYIPWCVISLNPALDLNRVHAHFQHEPLLFFDASKSKDELQMVLAATSPLAREEVLQSLENKSDTFSVFLWRQAKPGVARYRLFSDVKDSADLMGVLERLLNGDAHTKKEQAPSL